MISIMVSRFDYKHRCLIEKNVPIALILPSRWEDGAESLGTEHTTCLCRNVLKRFILVETKTLSAESSTLINNVNLALHSWAYLVATILETLTIMGYSLVSSL